ncbi:MAG: hypothetical protein NTY98_03930 [Verrucomicrobia bacterium]|nr:hypothetical protein [Verrucomicrobiota bacterium]
MNMDPNRLHVLFAAHSDGRLTAEEHAELQERLRADAEARRLWFVHQDVEDGLHALAQQDGAVDLAAPAANVKAAHARRGWLQWRPLTAAAAGLVLGLFSASVVFAYAVPRVGPWAERVLALPLADAGFEGEEAPAAQGVPVRFGLWSGDFSESTTAQQGVVPKEGRRMLRFLRADSAVSSAAAGVEKRSSGNLYQVVDLRAWREEIADGQAVVDWSAWYQWVPGAEETGMEFMTNVWAFTGTTEILPRNWKEHLYQETAKSSHRMNGEEARGKWRETAGRMTVPADTDFLVIELKVIPQGPGPEAGAGAYRFSGCFADDVRIVLRSHGRQDPQVAEVRATRR